MSSYFSYIPIKSDKNAHNSALKLELTLKLLQVYDPRFLGHKIELTHI